jgi:hypothetical protein
MKPLSPGLELGARFVLVRRIAEGGTAEVWLAEDREAGRRVALKLFDAAALAAPGAMARLRESLALSARLDPGHAVGVLGLHELDGVVAVAMEYLSGGDLGQLRGRPFGVFARPLVELAGVLAAVHRQGVVHRDLKCANVLLDAAGQVRLADFGLATVVGGPAAAASPYNMSPQQLRGEPAAPSDDLYAFGAMLYELLSGHPPFYPDITRDRVLHEPVPPLIPRSPAPQRARDLALRLLSKSAEARPAGMEDVRAELERALQEPEDEGSARPVAVAPRPPGTPATAGPATRRLRAGGLAAVALAVAAGLAFVFLWLPGRMAERGAEGAQQATAAALAEAERARRAQAQAADLEQARAAAAQAREAFAARLASVEQQAAAVWATAPLAAAREQAREAGRKFDLGEYIAAKEHWDGAAAALAAIESGRSAALQDALAAGEEALRRGNAEAATKSFGLAAEIEPGNAAAQRGLERAARLDDVFAWLDEASRAEQAGRGDAAVEAYRKALALDAEAPGAAAAIERIESRRADEAFAAVMSRGMAAMADGRLEEAEASFGQARRMRPGAATVQEALDELARVRQADRLQALTARALQAEQAEDWQAARQAWSDALAIEPTLQPARDGVGRSTPRAQLDARLDAWLQEPQKLWSPEGKAAAEAALAEAASAPPPNAALSRRAAELAALLQAARTPVRLTLQSDGQTEVVIYRVGRIGTFQRHELEVIPGRYAVVGTRPGYRDVRREVEIVPGSAPEPVMVKCEEPL